MSDVSEQILSRHPIFTVEQKAHLAEHVQRTIDGLVAEAVQYRELADHYVYPAGREPFLKAADRAIERADQLTELLEKIELEPTQLSMFEGR